MKLITGLLTTSYKYCIFLQEKYRNTVMKRETTQKAQEK